ncbi:MAG: 30S ribosomal protein S17 [Candidatus Buchananbacteria bacterium RBG_13_36_9]|uniref:Small ribosomal subunit protein uS17 n=1 Tax=Candidatus Buchananbacteria bacterium RBG_13_36_9 TaxID=1797530 RepID=A0A1G1XN26_9BACT|nr:MAG: 30S ribosomal protein S17 [Candidatus Buchananbacteria bacterium RBG_13_36_9]
MTKESKIKNKRRLEGIVVSNKMAKTIVVNVTRFKIYSKYKKQYKVAKKYKAHDEKQIAKIGNQVVFEECRPFSKEVKWRLIKIIK